MYVIWNGWNVNEATKAVEKTQKSDIRLGQVRFAPMYCGALAYQKICGTVTESSNTGRRGLIGNWEPVKIVA